MRARYSAFVRGDAAFLVRTLHRDHEDRAVAETALLARLAAHAKRARYRGLTVLDRDGPDADGIWRVLFHVALSIAGQDRSFVELSSFVRDGASRALRYVAGRGFPLSVLRRDEHGAWRATIADLEATPIG
jgi:SEC-C motif-containing protein